MGMLCGGGGSTGDAVGEEGTVGGGESIMSMSSSSESSGLVVWVELFGRVVVGLIVDCGSVEVARMQSPVGEVPQSVCSFVVVSWHACFAEASVGVVDVREVLVLGSAALDIGTTRRHGRRHRGEGLGRGCFGA
jgi:hypothetical protein